MTKTIMTLIGCAIIILSLASCASLKSKHYVGIKEPIEEIGVIGEESIWQFEDDVIYVRVVDSKTIIASSLDWNSLKKEFEVVTSQVVVTKLDENLFLNLKEEKDDLYTIFRLIPSSNGAMVFFTVDREEIKKHIQEGKVKAIEKDDTFILELTKEELDNYLRKNLNDLFDYDEAGILKPLKGFKKKQ